MSMNEPRLRGGGARKRGPYQLGQFPDELLYAIARQLIHRLAIGLPDISGDEFGTIFAAAIGGVHLGKPLGIADVVTDSCAWSVKTVKARAPFQTSSVRLISGRNSPDFAHGIANPRENPARTGEAVLSVWNARVDKLREYSDSRIVVMIRNMETRQFRIFEEEAFRFAPGEFRWEFVAQNLQGYDRANGEHRFTWQPHGSQFTVIRKVSASARRFSINQNITPIDIEAILNTIGFALGWITVHPPD